MTNAPVLPRAKAAAAPMPLLAPVTSAVFRGEGDASRWIACHIYLNQSFRARCAKWVLCQYPHFIPMIHCREKAYVANYDLTMIHTVRNFGSVYEKVAGWLFVRPLPLST